MRVCAVEGCEKPHYARGWCNKHYQRWWQHGDPLGGGPERQTRGVGVCSVEGCDRPHRGRGWCRMHYARAQSHVDLLAAAQERFDRSVGLPFAPGDFAFEDRGFTVNGRPSPCLIWQRGTARGYGRMTVRGELLYAHRFAALLAYGAVEGECHHLCRERLCANPAHLLLLSPEEHRRLHAAEKDVPLAA